MNVKRIKKAARAREAEIYNTLIGSVVLTVGILCGKSKIQMLKQYDVLKKHKEVLPDTIAEIVDYVWKVFGDDTYISLKDKIVLIYDETELFSPRVSFIRAGVDSEGEEAYYVMPLREDCIETGIIRAANTGKEGICVEFVYSPEESGKEIE